MDEGSRVSSREQANQSNRCVEKKLRCRANPSAVLRRGRESNPRIAVLQTATLPLGYPAVCVEWNYRFDGIRVNVGALARSMIGDW
jgi:hypothetical protein